MERFEDAETAQTVRENLTKAGKSAAGEGIAVAYWKDFKDSNQNLETYMNLLEYIANNVPGLDIAVAAQSSNTVTAGHSYYSYYSPAGSNTLKLDDFNSPCRYSPSGTCTSLQFKNRKGQCWETSFDEIIGIADMFFESPDEIFMDFEDGMMTGIVRCTEDSEYPGEPAFFQVEVQFIDDVDADQIHDIGEKFIGDCYDFHELFGFSAFDHEPKYTDEMLVQMLQACYPNVKMNVETRDGRPYIWDDKGVEYFLGGFVKTIEGEDMIEVDWNFPEEAWEWIPIPMEI